MRLQNPFAVVATTGLDAQVLTVLARSEQYLPVLRIHGLLPESGSPQGVRKAIMRLVEQGTVLERPSGRSLSYALNREHLLLEALLQIADAKRALFSRMASEIAAWPRQPLTVKVFGSAARDEMRSDSDIDVLIVMPDAVEAEVVEGLVSELAAAAARWVGNDVRPLVYRAGEVAPAAVFTDILEEGIDIAGDPAWLRQRVRRGRGAA